jgi:transposase-like protein
VAKRQTRLAGLDHKILGMYAGGMTVRDIQAHLADLYGVEIGRDAISAVTGAVAEDIAAWRSRPLDEIYAIVYPRRAERQGQGGAQRPQPLLLPGDRRHARGNA